jgi:hypothetical protein
MDTIDITSHRWKYDYVGTVVDKHITIIDIEKSIAGDFFILCILPDNDVHRYATWLYDPNTKNRWDGDYCFTLEQGINSLHRRVGMFVDA